MRGRMTDSAASWSGSGAQIKKELTEKENALLVYEGKQPEWVPIAELAIQTGMPTGVVGWSMQATEQYQRLVDIFGTVYNSGLDIHSCPMPDPSTVHCPDLACWRDYIKQPFPDPASFDWENDAARDTAGWDRENKLTSMLMGGTAAGVPFNSMVSFLGMEGACISMIEEPEAWHELIGLVTDWNVEIFKYTMKHYKPDIVCIGDDLASAMGPFMSVEMYREMIMPYQKRLVETIIEGGCIPEIHCCGKADVFVDDWVAMGGRSWQPAQVFNDLERVKAKYGNSFVIRGAWDSSGAPSLPGASEEAVRSAVRSSIDRLASGGGFIFDTNGMTDPEYVGGEHYGWIMDEAVSYGWETYHR